MNNIIIKPAILESDFLSVEKLLNYYKSLTTKIQIDICDGVFVPNKTWLPNAYDDIYGYVLDLEFDLMAYNPKEYLKYLFLYDMKSIVIHTDSMTDSDYIDLYKYIKSKNKYVQIAICDKNILKIKNLFGFYDYVQIMGIKNIGQQGQEFNQDIIKDIKDLRNYFEDKAKNMIIQIDGAMNRENILLCKNAGASSFAVGSYLKNSISNNNLKKVYKELKDL
jgi:ribulose-phosphate 3-epimerase